MRGTCSWSAQLLQISETSLLHWLQSAQVSWLGLCGPKPAHGQQVHHCLPRWNVTLMTDRRYSIHSA